MVQQNESVPIVTPSDARNLGFYRCRQEPRSLALLGMTLLMGFLFLTYGVSLPLFSGKVENARAARTLPLALVAAEREPVAVAASC